MFIGDSHIALLPNTEVHCVCTNFPMPSQHGGRILCETCLGEIRELQVYRENFGPFHCLCFGSMCDRSSHVLWRIANGEIDGANPKVCTVSIRVFY